AVRRAASGALAALVAELREEGLEVRRAGVAGSADRDLAKIGNQHIRAHAAEGILFRSALEGAARELGLETAIFAERDLPAIASKALKRPAASLRDRVAALGKGIVKPWRADEKSAATAAWIVLARRP